MSHHSLSPESQIARTQLARVTVDMTPENLAMVREFWEEFALAEPVDPRITFTDRTMGGVYALEASHANADPSRLLIYFHGGGYTMGSPHTHRAFAGVLSLLLGMPALVPAYRLAPEHPFPAGVEDGCNVYRALLAEGISPERVVIVGDSAGGGLAMSILLALREEGIPMPAAVVLISPFADLAGAGESLRTKAASDPVLDAIAVARVAERYIPQLAPTDPRVSSVYASLAGFPPIMIHVGTDEVLLSDAQRLAQRAQAAGVPVSLHEWEGLWHCFVLRDTLPESQAALKMIADFVQERT